MQSASIMKNLVTQTGLFIFAIVFPMQAAFSQDWLCESADEVLKILDDGFDHPFESVERSEKDMKFIYPLEAQKLDLSKNASNLGFFRSEYVLQGIRVAEAGSIQMADFDTLVTAVRNKPAEDERNYIVPFEHKTGNTKTVMVLVGYETYYRHTQNKVILKPNDPEAWDNGVLGSRLRSGFTPVYQKQVVSEFIFDEIRLKTSEKKPFYAAYQVRHLIEELGERVSDMTEKELILSKIAIESSLKENYSNGRSTITDIESMNRSAQQVLQKIDARLKD